MPGEAVDTGHGLIVIVDRLSELDWLREVVEESRWCTHCYRAHPAGKHTNGVFF